MLLRGDLHITRPGGGDEHETRAALCVCGSTANAPYCDGSGTCSDWPPRSAEIAHTELRLAPAVSDEASRDPRDRSKARSREADSPDDGNPDRSERPLSQAPSSTSGPRSAAGGEPFTVVITRTVEPGREDDYRAWLVRLIKATETTPNNLGTVILTPTRAEPTVYRLIHRFADEDSLRAWEDSDVRRRLSAEADKFSTSHRQAATGFEAWFSVPGLPQAPRWKMGVVTFFVAYALTAIIIPREMRWLPHTWSFYTTNIITNVLLSVLLTFVFLPLAARVLRPWLYRPHRDKQ